MDIFSVCVSSTCRHERGILSATNRYLGDTQERLLTEEAANKHDGVQSDEDHFDVGSVKDVIFV